MTDTMSLAELIEEEKSLAAAVANAKAVADKLPRLHTRRRLKDWLDTRLVIVRYGDHLLPDCRLKSRKDRSYW